MLSTKRGNLRDQSNRLDMNNLAGFSFICAWVALRYLKKELDSKDLQIFQISDIGRRTSDESETNEVRDASKTMHQLWFVYSYMVTAFWVAEKWAKYTPNENSALLNWGLRGTFNRSNQVHCRTVRTGMVVCCAGVLASFIQFCETVIRYRRKRLRNLFATKAIP